MRKSLIFLVILGGAFKNKVVHGAKMPYFLLFSFCNPSNNCKHASNLNAKGVNLNVIEKGEYSLIFIHIVRNFAFMSDFEN